MYLKLKRNEEKCQDHQKQGKSKNSSQSIGAQGNMTNNCHVVSWMGSWNSKRVLGKN